MKFLKGALRQYEISVRVDPDRGGPVAAKVHATDPTTQDAENLKLSDSRHILLLIHGFNNTAEAAANAYQQMIDLLVPDLLQMNEPDAIVCLQWPGDYAIGPLKQADFIGYPIDIDRARRSASVLRKYLEELCALKGGFKISIIAHSMGCRLALEMLNGSQARPTPVPLPIAIVGLMAAAVPVALVDRSWTGNGGPYLAHTDAMSRAMLKFHSQDDWVLWLAFPAGETLAFTMALEPAAFIEAVGYLGDPANFAEEGLTRSHGHSEYWGDAAVERRIISALGAAIPRALPSAAIAARALPARATISSRRLPPARAIPG